MFPSSTQRTYGIRADAPGAQRLAPRSVFERPHNRFGFEEHCRKSFARLDGTRVQ